MINAFIIAAFAYMSVSALFAYTIKNPYFIRFGAFASVIFLVSVVTTNVYVAFMMYAALCVYVTNTEPKNLIYFYIALLPVFPIDVELPLGLPGIDTLVVLNHYRVIVLAMLAPAIFKILAQGGRFFDPLKTYSGFIDRLVIVFIVLQAISLFRDYDLLVASRRSIFLFVDIWIPYFVISRSVKSVGTALVILLYTAIMMAVIGFIEQKIFLRIFDAITLPMGEPYIFVKTRNGLMRAYASMSNPLILGFLFAMVFLLAIKVRDLVAVPRYTPFIFAFLVILGSEATVSRSPIFGNVIGVLVLLWWSLGRDFVVKTAKYAFIVFWILLIAFFSGGAKFLFAFDDDQGTFQYRYDLIFNASEIIVRSPLFGTSPWIYLKDPAMLRSLQGEGIIDITNTYLLIALNSGLPALMAYVGIWFALLRGLYSVQAKDELSAILMGVCIVTMVMLFITSPISFASAYYWLLIALVCGYIRQWQIGNR